MRQPWRQPRGGWKIAKLPARFTNKDLRFAWENRKVRTNNDHNSAVEEMTTFLRKNGHVTNRALKKEIRDHADDLWREKDPHRFPKKSEKASVVKNPNVRKMAWAAWYWQCGNILMANDHPEPAAVLERFVRTGLDLLSGDQGCEHCEMHWNRLITKYPPSLADTMEKARVWLWAAHNISRENLPPTPFDQIALAWNWPKLTTAQVHGILDGMGMSDIR